MNKPLTHSKGWKRGRTGFAIIAALALTSACETTTAVGDAGCSAYGISRVAMPQEPLPVGPWGIWVANTDDVMTGTCT